MKIEKLIAAIVIVLLANLPLTIVSALEITNVRVENKTISSASIKWDTDEEANSSVYYGKTTAAGLEKSDSSIVLEHAVELTDLTEDTKYYFAVESYNATGNKSYDNNNGEYYNFITSEKVEISLNLTENLTNITNDYNYLMSGKTKPNASVKFFVNEDTIESKIIETGLFKIEADENGTFEGTILLDGGGNNITVVAYDKVGNIIRAYHQVLVDRNPPAISLEKIRSPRSNKTVLIKGSVNEPCAMYANLSFENATTKYSINISSDLLFSKELSLSKDGKYNLSIIAVDRAGNMGRIIQIIAVDTKPPTIKFETKELQIPYLKEETEVKKEFHSPYIDIEGKTEPNSRVEIINLGNNSRITVNITQYEKEYKTIEGGFRFDILSPLIKHDETTDSDSEGNFKATITLLEGENNLLVRAIDGAGNGKTVRRVVRLKPGSRFWKLMRVSSIPNEIYTNNLGAGDIPTSLFFDISYLGSTSDLSSVKITVVKDGNAADNKYIKKPGTTITYYNEDEDKYVAYTTLTVNQYADDPYELPDQLNFELTAQVRYSEKGKSMSEIVYLKTALSVQKPLKYTKWLTHERINKSIKQLDKWIKDLDKGIDYTEKAVLGTTAACIGLWIYAMYEAAFSPEHKISESTKKWLYGVCDRIACPYINPDCGGKMEFDKDKGYLFGELDEGTYSLKWLGEKSAGEVGTKTWREAGCEDNEFVVQSIISQKDPSLAGEALKLGALNIYTPTGGIRKGGTTDYFCTNRSKDDFYGIKDFQMSQTGAKCWTENEPYYDGSKCLLNSGITGTSPYNDIVTSAQCVCLTGMWRHLENLQRILFGMKKCLGQAYIGNVRGGYCERLFAQFACDIIQWALKAIFTPKGVFGGKERGPEVGGARAGIADVNKDLGGRYKGVLDAQFGLSSDQLIHTACIGAVTGDWSTLREAAIAKLKAPVAPVIGPMMPESRITGYNPFTGELTIQYLLTLGIMSGGQEVRAKLNLYCDPSVGGDGCPDDQVVYLYERPVTFYVPKDGTMSRNHLITLPASRYWFNKAELEIEYLLGGTTQKKILTEPIVKKGEMILQCHWQIIPPMFVCEKIGEDLYGTIELTSVGRSPKSSKYYPNNDLNVKLDLRKIGDYDFSTRPAYVYWKLTKPDGSIDSGYGGYNEIKKIEDEGIINFNILNFKKEPTGEYLTEWEGTWDLKELKEENYLYIVAGKEVTTDGKRTEIKTEQITELIINDKECENIGDYMWRCNETIGKDNMPAEIKVKTEKPEIFWYQNKSKLSYDQINITKWKRCFTITADAAKTPTTYTTGVYNLIIDLYEDADKSGDIDPEKDKKIIYSGKNQTSRPDSFKYELTAPADCSLNPMVDIVYPRDNAYIKEKEETIKINVWDDCNKIGKVVVSATDEQGVECGKATSTDDKQTYEISIDLSDCEGKVNLKVKATDKKENSGEASIKLIVNIKKE